MDKQNFYKALMAGLIAFLVWNLLSSWLMPPIPSVPDTAEQPTSTQDTNPPYTLADQAVKPTDLLPEGIGLRIAEEPSFIELGNTLDEKDSAFPFHLRLSSRGASITDAWLSYHKEKVDEPQRYHLLRPIEVQGRLPVYSMATEKVSFGQGLDYPLNDVDWVVQTNITESLHEAVFEVEFVRDDDVFAKLSKAYRLKPNESGSGHHDMEITYTFENVSAEPLTIQLSQFGPVGLSMEDPRADTRKVVAGVSDGLGVFVTSDSQIENHALEPGIGQTLVTERSPLALSWIAVSNKFFTAITSMQGNNAASRWVRQADAVRMANLEDQQDDASFRLLTNPIVLSGGAQESLTFDCFLGPKSRQLFRSEPDYIDRNYEQLVIGDYYWCAWAWLVNVMLWLLYTCKDVWPYNYGVAIFVMVVIVRTLLHPVTKKGQVNMTKMASQMAEIQPKMEEIKRKYGSDRQRMNQETMKLYQEQGINPASQMLTCVPMMLQMPIWGALWAALNFTVDLRHQPFYLWIIDLTAPDRLIKFDQAVPLLGDGFNLIPLLLGLSMWLQQRFMPKPAQALRREQKSQDQMAQQRMMMNIMSVFFVFIFYSAPSGLTIYIMASNVFGLAEQYFVRKHINALELQKEVASKQSKPRVKKPAFWEKLEKLADQAKEQQKKR